MKKAVFKKLALSRETVCSLQSSQLEKIQGGAPPSVFTDCEACWSYTCGATQGC